MMIRGEESSVRISISNFTYPVVNQLINEVAHTGWSIKLGLFNEIKN